MRVFCIAIFSVLLATAAVAQKTWNGSVSTDWTVADNWTPSGMPSAADAVIIPDTSGINAPTMPGYSGNSWTPYRTCASLTIEAGGVLNNGFGLEVQGNFTNFGTFGGQTSELAVWGNLTNHGTFTVGTGNGVFIQGNLVNNGTFNHSNGLVVMSGSANAEISGSAGSTVFWRLRIQKSNNIVVELKSPVQIQGTGTGASAGLHLQGGIFRSVAGGNLVADANTLAHGTGSGTAQLQVNDSIMELYNLSTAGNNSALREVIVGDGGNLRIAGTHSVANRGMYVLNGGVLHLLPGSMHQNGGGWSYLGNELNIAGGGQLVIEGNAEFGQLVRPTFDAGSIVRIAGSTDSTLNFTDNQVVSFNIPDLRIEKTGGAKARFVTNATGFATSHELEFGDITINDGAILEYEAGSAANSMHFVVSGDLDLGTSGELHLSGYSRLTTFGSVLSTGGSISSATDTSFIMSGFSTTVLKLEGDNTFHDFTIVEAGMTVEFEAGSTTTVDGHLTLQGFGTMPLVLRSTSPGNTWEISHNSSYSVHHVDVQDSVATTLIVNQPGGVDSGNNTNWRFGAMLVDATPGTVSVVYSNATDVVAGHFSVESTGSAAADIYSFTIAASGTGDDEHAFANVRLYRATGTSFNINTDVLIDTHNGFPTDDGSLVFQVSGGEQSFPGLGTRDYYIVVSLANTAAPGDTFQFTVTAVSTDTSVGPLGLPSDTMVGLEMRLSSMAVVDNSFPVVQNAFPGSGGFVIQRFTAYYPEGPDVILEEITFTGSTTGGDLEQDITEIAIYRDSNNNNLFDPATDALVGTSSGFDSSGVATVIPTGTEATVTAAALTYLYFVVITFDQNAPVGSQYGTQITGMQGGNTGPAFTGVPAPASSTTPGLILEAPNLTVAFEGPNNEITVNSDSQGPGGNGHVIWRGTLSTQQFVWGVTGLVFTGVGTANHNQAYSELALYEDTQGTGVFDPTVSQLAAPVGTSFNSSNEFYAALNNATFAAQTQRRFFLVGKLAGIASFNQTLGAELTSLDATPPAGGQAIGDLGVPSTALRIDAAGLTVAAGPDNPGGHMHKAGDALDHVLAQVRMSASNDDIEVESFILTTGGSGDWSTSLHATNGVEVWADNGDGTFNPANDTLLFQAPGGSPSVNVQFTPALVVPNQGLVDLWVVVRVPANSGLGLTQPVTFNASIASAGNITLADPVNHGVSVVAGPQAPVSANLGLVDFFVTDIDPLRGDIAGGDELTIEGSGFMAPFQVFIGGALCGGTANIQNNGTLVTGLLAPAGLGSNLTDVVIEIKSGDLDLEVVPFTYKYDASFGRGSSDNGGCSQSGGSGLWWLALLAAPALLLRRRNQAGLRA